MPVYRSKVPKRGVRLASREAVFQEAGIIVQARAPGANPERGREDLPLFRPGRMLIGFGQPLTTPRECADLAERACRSSRWSLCRASHAPRPWTRCRRWRDRGCKAVLHQGAVALPELVPMMMTAASTVTPAKVLVLGTGVAGLQAIATARRFDAVVSASDVRSAVKEQIEGPVAKFIVLEIESAEGERRLREGDEPSLLQTPARAAGRVLREQDILITTAEIGTKQRRFSLLPKWRRRCSRVP